MHSGTGRRIVSMGHPSAARMRLLTDYHRILWCLRYGIGDVVMELPVLEALRSYLPHAQVTVLGAHPAIELLDDDPRVNRRLSLQELGLSHRWDRGTDAARRHLSSWIEQSSFDLVLDARHAPPALAEAIHAGGLPILDSDPDAERAAVAAGNGAVDAVRESVAVGWGIPVDASRAIPRYRVAAADVHFAARLLDASAAAGCTIGIAPLASLSLKRWPIHRFSQLADWITGELDAHLVLFCGPEEGLGQEILRGIGATRRYTLVGPLHLGKVSALLTRCEVLVSNDTGIAHLAAAVETPTIGIFGPTDPRIYRPAGQSAISVGGEGIECAYRNVESLEPPGCWSGDRCLISNEGCIHRVELAEVKSAILRAMEDAATRSRSQHADDARDHGARRRGRDDRAGTVQAELGTF